MSEPTTVEIVGYWVEDDDSRDWKESPYDCIAMLCDHLDAAEAKVRKLQAIIDKHNLCHDLHGKVGRDEFEEGCKQETIKEFGSCGWAEKLAELEEENRRLTKRSRKVVKALSSMLTWFGTMADDAFTEEGAVRAVENARRIVREESIPAPKRHKGE